MVFSNTESILLQVISIRRGNSPSYTHNSSPLFPKKTAVRREVMTTVEIPMYPIGAAAMEMLVNLISEKKAEKFRWLDTKLLIRDSTAKR